MSNNVFEKMVRDNFQSIVAHGDGNYALVSVQKKWFGVRLAIDGSDADLTNQQVDELIKMLKKAKGR